MRGVSVRGREVRVLVVGAGVAGLAAARALHAWGASVLVVERASAPATGTGIFLPGNAMRALGDLGLAEQVRARGVVIERQTVGDRTGRQLFELELDDVWHGVGPCVALPRSGLHEVLLAGTSEVPILWGCTPRAISQAGRDVRVDLSDGTGAAYDLVVGADGVHSTVRRTLFGGSRQRGLGQYAQRFLTSWPDVPPVWSLTVGTRSVFLTIPVAPDRVYCYCDSSAAQSLPGLLAEYPDPIPRLLERAESDVHRAPNAEVILPHWSRGAVVLIGDAAHATSPNMAQGAAMAVEDALVLVDSLDAATDVPDALRQYENRRRGRTGWVMRQTRRRDGFRRLPAPVRNAVFRHFGPHLFRASHQPLRTPVTTTVWIA